MPYFSCTALNVFSVGPIIRSSVVIIPLDTQCEMCISGMSMAMLAKVNGKGLVAVPPNCMEEKTFHAWSVATVGERLEFLYEWSLLASSRSYNWWPWICDFSNSNHLASDACNWGNQAFACARLRQYGNLLVIPDPLLLLFFDATRSLNAYLALLFQYFFINILNKVNRNKFVTTCRMFQLEQMKPGRTK